MLLPPRRWHRVHRLRVFTVDIHQWQYGLLCTRLSPELCSVAPVAPAGRAGALSTRITTVWVAVGLKQIYRYCFVLQSFTDSALWAGTLSLFLAVVSLLAKTWQIIRSQLQEGLALGIWVWYAYWIENRGLVAMRSINFKPQKKNCTSFEGYSSETSVKAWRKSHSWSQKV